MPDFRVPQQMDIKLDNGMLPGYMSLYESQETTYAEMSKGNPIIAQMTGVEEGIFIINNEDMASLQGIQAIKTIKEGPVVISNNPRLHMPISTMIDWLLSLEGNVTSVDLSFNDLYGQVPESFCDLLTKVPKIDLSNNINLCGSVPTCLSGVKSSILNITNFYDEPYEEESWYDGSDYDYDSENGDEDALKQVTRLQSFVQMWSGNNVGDSCDLLNLTSGFSDDVIGCSPLGYTTKLGNQGEIVFNSLDIEMQQFKDTSCAWELDLDSDSASSGANSSSDANSAILLLEFNEFYTSINGDQGICNDFSSGHNFNNPILNGPTIDMFTVSVFNETYKRGLTVFSASGSEEPPPFILKVDPSYTSVMLTLKEQMSPD